MYRDNDMNISFTYVAQIDMASRLMMNIKARGEEGFQEFAWSSDRKLWHS